MKKFHAAMLGLAALSGCVSTEGGSGKFMRGHQQGDNFSAQDGVHQGHHSAMSVPGVQGPWGSPVAVASPYQSIAPSGEAAAKAMIANSVPLQFVQQGGNPFARAAGMQGAMAGLPAGMVTPNGMISPPGVPALPGMPGGAPNEILLASHRNLCGPNGCPMPGPAGAVPAMGAITSPQMAPMPAQRTEVRFAEPAGLKISWYAPGPDGKPGFNAQYLEAPGRYNFLQGAIYRLKISTIPSRPGVDLYPTLEVIPSTGKTNTFLAHSAVPVSFTEEDLQQVTAGNFVVKVIYLPDPQFQDLATAGGLDEVVSSRLEPGVDPIAEAQRRGSILLIVRMGNIDLEAPNTPAMDAPPGGGMRPPVPPPGMMGNPGMGRMVPYGIMGPGAMPGIPGASMGMPGRPGIQGFPGNPGLQPTLPGAPAQLPGVLPPAAPQGAPKPPQSSLPQPGDSTEITIPVGKATLIPSPGLDVVPVNIGIAVKDKQGETKPVSQGNKTEVLPVLIPPFTK
ncbi:MAG: hypothetical protein EXR99_08125 [Gemmataceae bacterium]|nr:hypothetical protein [Gemmataceae bacterium]